MRRVYPFMALLLLAIVAAAVWPRPVARPLHAYTVTQLVRLLQAHPTALNGRIVAVSGYYHHGCPYCTWDAPPSLSPGPSWAGPIIVVDLPGTAQSNAEPALVSWWRTLPLLGRLAPLPPITDLSEGARTFSGTIVPCVADSCGGPQYVMRVLSVSG